MALRDPASDTQRDAPRTLTEFCKSKKPPKFSAGLLKVDGKYQLTTKKQLKGEFLASVAVVVATSGSSGLCRKHAVQKCACACVLVCSDKQLAKCDSSDWMLPFQLLTMEVRKGGEDGRGKEGGVEGKDRKD